MPPDSPDENAAPDSRVTGREPAALATPGSATGRIVRGLGAHGAGMGVSVLVQLVTVPVLLSAWGVSTYGHWLVLSAFPTYVALSDLSFSSVAGNSMVMLRASGHHDEAVILGRRLWSIVTAMGALGMAAGVTIAVIAGERILPNGPIPASEATIVLAALFADVVVGLQLGVFDAWFRAAGRYPTAATLRQITRLAEYGALLGAVLLGAGPGTAAVALFVGGVAGVCVSWVVLKRVVPWSIFRLERPDLPTARRLFAPGMAFAAFPIGNAISVQGFTIAIGATLGTSAVVVFSTTRTLTRIALQAMASINAAIAPELSRAVGGAHFDEARVILRRGVQLSFVVATTIVVTLAIIGQQVIAFWTRGLVSPDPALLNTLLLVMLANSVWYTLSAGLIATNHHSRLATLYLGGTLVALVVSVPLSRAFGLTGAALSLLVIDVALTVYVFRASARLLGDTPTRLLRSVLDLSRSPAV